MEIKHGHSKSSHGPGVSIALTGAEVATAVRAYLVAHGVYADGPTTVTVNGELCESGEVFVDPEGFAMADGVRIRGDGTRDV